MSVITDAIAVASQAQVPLIIWGPPGTGKTAFTYALADTMNAHLETLIASIRQPEDFGGLPVPQEDGLHMMPFAWATRAKQHNAEGDNVLIFFDEVSTAPPAVQASLLRVFLDKEVGDISLLVKDQYGNVEIDNISILCAANPPDQAAGGFELAAPLANRCVHLDWRLDAGEWADGMVQGFPLPNIPLLSESWEESIPQNRALVASFVRTRPELLCKVPKESSQAGRAWPSGRTWDMAARLMTAADASGDPTGGISNALLMGTVGEAAAIEFTDWVNSLDLPDPESLLSNPSSFQVDKDRKDKVYAILSGVVSRVVTKYSPKRYEAAWEILAKAAQDDAIDVAAGSAKALANIEASDIPDVRKHLGAFIPMLKEAGLIEVDE